MRRGQFRAPFLGLAALAGLLIGIGVALASSLLSTDVAFIAIIVASGVLAVVASGVRALLDKTDQAGDVRNVAALPLDRVPLVKKLNASAPLSPDPDTDELDKT